MPSSSSTISPPSDDGQSIWEILNLIETKLFASIHQSTQSLLPQIIDTSHELFQQVHSISEEAYHSSLQLAQHHLDLLSSILPNQFLKPTSSSSSSSSISNLSPQQPSSLANSSIPSSDQPSPQWFIQIFKPRNFIILASVFLSSRFTLNLFIHSTYFDQWSRSNPRMVQRIPKWLISPHSQKMIKRRTTPSFRGNQTRQEVIIVLGTDPGSAGSQIALHLTQIGYIVISSVSRVEYVASLEQDGLGWLKALVLDPLILNQTRAFTRSLAACLNLKFPLNSTHACHQPDRHSSLIGLINCLPISSPDILRPIESVELDDHLISPIQSIVGLSLEVIKVVLPMIRNSIEKFGAEDGVILTLFPTKTTSVPLPYLGTSIVANQALETLMTTLRREIMISNSDIKQSIRIINEKIGSFRPSNHFIGTVHHSATATIDQPLPSLPIHLHSIYAPSLSRRIGILNLPTTGLSILSPKGSPISELIKRVQEIVQSSSIHNGSCISTGKEVWKFNIIQHYLPTFIVENWLKFTEHLNGWVRKKVISEIDLESNENLEKMIQKRNFSSTSHWKNLVFLDHHLEERGKEKHQEKQEKAEDEEEKNEEVEKEAEHTTIQETSIKLPNPPEFITCEPNQDHPEAIISSVDTIQEKQDDGDETGSIIDKGEETASQFDHIELVPQSPTHVTPNEDDNLQHSFVGSEVDWKENSVKS